MSLEKCSEIPLLERQKFRTLTSNAGEDVEPQELSLTAGGNAEWGSYLGRQSGSFLQNILEPYDPAIVFLSIYPNELEVYPYKNLQHYSYCQNLEAPRCPLTNEWINVL